MTEHLGLSPKPPEVEIPLPNSEVLEKIKNALKVGDSEALSMIAGENPRELFTWAALAISKITSSQLIGAEDKITAYAFARIGYHRGLDTLRANGWRGSGFVRATSPGNRGFLTCLLLLSYLAGQINEEDEKERCDEFLSMLDPSLSSQDIVPNAMIDFLFNN